MQFLRQPNNYSCGPTSLTITLQSLGFIDINLDSFPEQTNGYSLEQLVNTANQVDRVCCFACPLVYPPQPFNLRNQMMSLRHSEDFRIILNYKNDEHPNGHHSPLISMCSEGVCIMDVSRPSHASKVSMSWQCLATCMIDRGYSVIMSL